MIGRRSTAAVLAASISGGAIARAQDTVPGKVPGRGAASLPAAAGDTARGGGTPTFIERTSSSGAVSVMVATSGARGARSADSLQQAVVRCLTRLARPVPALTSPWAAFDSATAGRAFVLLQMWATVGAPAPCRESTEPAVAAAGLLLLGEGVRAYRNDDLREASLALNGHEVAPALAGRVESVIVSGEIGDSTMPRVHQLRLYFAPDALAPDRRGRFAPARLRIVTADPKIRHTIEVPDTTLHRAWRELSSWRVARLRGKTRRLDLPPIPAPHDSVLRRARDDYDAGNAIAAAELVAWRRAERALDASDTRFVALVIGSALLAYGDTAGARVELRDALADSPCFRFPAAPAFDGVLASVASRRVRCGRVGVARLLGSGLAVPGGGQWVRGDRFGAGAAAIVTGGLFAVAAERLLRSQQQYRDYQRAVAPPLVDPLLDRANATRGSARRYAVAAVAAWASSALAAVLAEKLHPAFSPATASEVGR